MIWGKLCFEIIERDLCGRIGILGVRGKRLVTPAFLPVVNPKVQVISPTELYKEFGVCAIFTNAYIIYQDPELRNKALNFGLHRVLGFDGIVATDSGAYQGYMYGRVDIDPSRIEGFQEQIDADMAVILDVPVRLSASYGEAKENVLETIKRAKSNVERRERDDLLWFGPVHGAQYLDLVKYSAREMSKLSFHVYAVGSVVEALVNYKFDLHVDIIMVAKEGLPCDKPVHIFGIGHPMFFAFPVALGCDMFDSAAYALYAREDRYITDYGTIKLERLQYFPCSCKICSSYSPGELKGMLKEEREEALARHNLYACLSEIRRIRQAISEGRLWELLELRARSHPYLLEALRRLRNYRDVLEKMTPITKVRGIFYFGSTGLPRPEIVRHQRRIKLNYEKPAKAKVLVLLPQTSEKPFHKARRVRVLFRKIREILEDLSRVHICFYAAPFGVIPAEIDEVYPLSQFEVASIDDDTKFHVAREVGDFIRRQRYDVVILHSDRSTWKNIVADTCRRVCQDLEVGFVESASKESWAKDAIDNLVKILKSQLVMKKSQANQEESNED